MSNDNQFHNPSESVGTSRRRFLTQASTAVAGAVAALTTPSAEAQHSPTRSAAAKHSLVPMSFFSCPMTCVLS